ncbi:HAMP domain-containing histidine kinase [Roseateles sp. DAIF2]|uniref:sensor histidine kinase n=1 Tax=Roseateles sp. DAIF2 TaxID=2714952 RepID=UPI0018A24B13|nr:HAMP domain-containing sensor histidine kinase [Roseateles sp. DAIF2]QPF71798.1 HAMP domain-containing histidine kinase [Roseateles sp. DAIF2]
MYPPAPPARADARFAWLSQQRDRYLAEPCAALELVGPLQARLDLALAGEPDDFAIELAWLLAEMYGELWQAEKVEQPLDAVLPWMLAGHGSLTCRVGALALRCRMHLRFGRRAEGMALLQILTELSVDSEDPLVCAHRARALGHALAGQRDWQRAIDCLREAQALATEAGDGGRWVDMLITIAVAHQALGDPQAQLTALREGALLAEAQRRWLAGMNSWSGVAEEGVLRGELELAGQALERAQQCRARAGASAERLIKELLATEAQLHAAHGRLEPAIALMHEVIVQSERWSMRRQLLRRMRQLVPWLMQAGRPAEALALLERAHKQELVEQGEIGRRDAAEQLRRAELAHALGQQARSEAHARELELKNGALEQALALQRELQSELLEAGKLASLGQLLAGMAHELNTPLGTALTALSTSADLSRALSLSIGDGRPASRQRVLADLQHCEQGAELARRNVEQALTLVQAYQAAGQQPDRPRLLRLDTLVRAAWERALSPDTRLCLELDAALELHTLAEPLNELLVQLFHNVERHAYAPGQPGLVRVSAHRADGRVRLVVQDHGAGIAPELLPRVFDPYVSSQFGHGRSGLGLFIAQAAVTQRLRGRVRVESQPRRGARFEIDWPLSV